MNRHGTCWPLRASKTEKVVALPMHVELLQQALDRPIAQRRLTQHRLRRCGRAVRAAPSRPARSIPSPRSMICTRRLHLNRGRCFSALTYPAASSGAVRVSGLDAGQEVTLRAERRALDGQRWSARAVYRARGDGIVDADRDRALTGTFLGRQPDGLLWSMRAPGPGPFVVPYAPRPVSVTVEPAGGGRGHAARPEVGLGPGAALHQAAPPPGRSRRRARPPARSPPPPGRARPRRLGREVAGLPRPRAGLPRLPGPGARVLQVTRTPSTPGAHPARGVRPHGPPAPRASRGRSAPRRRPRARAAQKRHYSPPSTSPGSSGVSWGRCRARSSTRPPPVTGAAWTLRGRPLTYDRSLGATPDPPASAILAERIRGPLLLLGAEEDAVWPRAAYARALRQRRGRRDDHVLVFPHAGHFAGILYPRVPLHCPGDACDAGGTPTGNGLARIRGWRALLAFERRRR